MHEEQKQDIIRFLLEHPGESYGRWEVAGIVGAGQTTAIYVFEQMRCLEPVGERPRKGNQQAQHLTRLVPEKIPASCEECTFNSFFGACRIARKGMTHLPFPDTTPPDAAFDQPDVPPIDNE
ncbi:hypothetical protein HY087_00035 [Candidatus Gottesmanbacteria bacterium]|nr:hypothetical protein [Candidatus Gottesmanbacteria bacterium]